jgi:hypothetical protein
MNEQLLREWIRKVLLTEAQGSLDSKKVLGYIAEWSVFLAVSGGVGNDVKTNEVWEQVVIDGRIRKSYASALSADIKSMSPDDATAFQASNDLSQRQQSAYDSYVEMANVFKATSGGETFGGPEGSTTPSNQPSTAPIDVPCANADIHVKYNDRKRLESFRRKAASTSASSGFNPGAPSTTIYDEVIAEMLQPGGKLDATQLPTYAAFEALKISDAQLFTSKKIWKRDEETGRESQEATGERSTSLRKPVELSEKSAYVDKRKSLIKKSLDHGIVPPEWENPGRPMGLIPATETGSKAAAKLKALGARSYKHLQGDEVPTLSTQTQPWWNSFKEADGGMNDADLAILARYDDIAMAYKAWTTERANTLKLGQGRKDLYTALDKKGYKDQLKSDLLQQHFRGVDAANAAEAADDGDAHDPAAQRDLSRPAWYAKFEGGPGSHTVKMLRYPKVLDPTVLEVRKNPGKNTKLFKVFAPHPEGGSMVEMLILEYDFSGQNKPPTLNTGANYDIFVQEYMLPTLRSAGDSSFGSRFRPTHGGYPGNIPESLKRYVREMLKLLRS